MPGSSDPKTFRFDWIPPSASQAHADCTLGSIGLEPCKRGAYCGGVSWAIYSHAFFRNVEMTAVCDTLRVPSSSWVDGRSDAAPSYNLRSSIIQSAIDAERSRLREEA